MALLWRSYLIKELQAQGVKQTVHRMPGDSGEGMAAVFCTQAGRQAGFDPSGAGSGGMVIIAC